MSCAITWAWASNDCFLARSTPSTQEPRKSMISREDLPVFNDKLKDIAPDIDEWDLHQTHRAGGSIRVGDGQSRDRGEWKLTTRCLSDFW